MKMVLVESLRGCASVVRDSHPRGEPSMEYVAFGLATEYVRAVMGNEWTNQMVFSQHSTVAPHIRGSRDFMRADAKSSADGYRNQERTLHIAELLFNLQSVEGIDGRVEDCLKPDRVEPTYAELEAGAFLLRRGVSFKFVEPSGVKGSDYDGQLRLVSGVRVNCEMKCKIESTTLARRTVRNTLRLAGEQLPDNEPGLIFLKIPEAWATDPNAPILRALIGRFLLRAPHVVAVVLRWEQLTLPAGGGGAIDYRFEVERSPVVPPPVEPLLEQLTGQGIPVVSFRAIAQEAAAKVVVAEQR
jgi:hypothetical protein